LLPKAHHTDSTLVNHTQGNKAGVSKLKLLVPPLGTFFTPLRLNDAFLHQDEVRRISSRRFVPPSFNDVRAILNTAQIMSLSKDSGIELVTFDGDVTLYDDGKSLTPDNAVIPRLLSLLKRGIRVGIVTAAGYTEASKYYQRLHGLLDAVHQAKDLGDLRNNLIVMGGESNFLFKYDDDVPERLVWVSRKEWVLEEMKTWTEDAITGELHCALTVTWTSILIRITSSRTPQHSPACSRRMYSDDEAGRQHPPQESCCRYRPFRCRC